ncbi:Alpha/Beta hydrolase protein [Suillus bovinus]|uniref:Alpha/Beta hydrolase protein n=1 Tax=Suillus bovinus TaxID=48563 RepID=UPI001B868097|nr:Alpha/Beta hydrolase protein [Suillus bovinus]KAG2144191.1 Alpha/Beta hydrolase protein [Suillus bovinus]
MSIQPDNDGLFPRLRKVFAVLGFLYLGAVILLAVPWVQSHILYMNALKLPWNAHFDAPERHGLAPGKTANIKIQTVDNHTLGAWFILSDAIYHNLPFPPLPSAAELHISEAVAQRPTVLFFHGNAATRALDMRVRLYSGFTSRLDANVLAIDYRGFGDNPGTPTEDGLSLDARAAWDWLIAQGASPQDVLIVGHSLGTAVASSLSVSLSEDGVKFRGTVLMSPFSSLHTLIDTYNIFGVFPVMLPINMIPRAAGIYKSFLVHKFDTLSVISKLKVPILILHAEDDWDISHTHSDALFDALLEPYLPPISPPESQELWSTQQWSEYHSQLVTRRETRESLLTRTVIPNFGIMDQFDGFGERITLLKTSTGSHNMVGTLEGVQEVIRNTFFTPENLR